jgi:hypothetical protein
LQRYVNQANFISLSTFHEVRKLFRVSLTGLLVRWTQLSHYPIATIAIKNGRIRYGWISKPLRERGGYQIRRGEACLGKDAKAFAAQNQPAHEYRQGEGSGAMANWIDFDRVRLLTQEFYFTIPHTNTVWVLAIADEGDLVRYREE